MSAKVNLGYDLAARLRTQRAPPCSQERARATERRPCALAPRGPDRLLARTVSEVGGWIMVGVRSHTCTHAAWKTRLRQELLMKCTSDQRGFRRGWIVALIRRHTLVRQAERVAR
eukprot:6191668-Pleurochrysis_carterae.AAC.2